MQTELLDTNKWKTRVELSTAIFDWIEVFYHRFPRHSSLGNISPVGSSDATNNLCRPTPQVRVQEAEYRSPGRTTGSPSPRAGRGPPAVGAVHREFVA